MQSLIQRGIKFSEVNMDDLETSEHTKLKPLSISIVVSKHDRKILGFRVSRIPARGLIAEKSRQKYGYRKDERPENLDQLFEQISPLVAKDALISTDSNPLYPIPIQKHLGCAHFASLSRKASIAGQGELKEGGHDPLFAINHTCAMFRANLSRLIRRTWCTTKKIESLIDHISIYVMFHNRELTKAI